VQGELIADLGENWLGEKRKKHLERWSTALLVLALSVSLISLVLTNELSGNVIGSLGDRAEDSDRKVRTAIADLTKALTTFGQALDADINRLCCGNRIAPLPELQVKELL
jgi:hypothetical protein